MALGSSQDEWSGGVLAGAPIVEQPAPGGNATNNIVLGKHLLVCTENIAFVRLTGITLSPALGQPLNAEFFSGARYLSYDPRKPTPTNFDILMRLGQIVGPGVTKAETRLILRRCKLCRRFMYVERCSTHRCAGAVPDIQGQAFDLVETLFSLQEHAGLGQGDLLTLLSTCDTCRRVVINGNLVAHFCSEYDYH